MPEPLNNPRYLLETAWRRITELEAEVRGLTQLAVANERLVKANADLEADLLRLNKLVDELARENALLRRELAAAKALVWQVDESAPPEESAA
jgi:uncharacterized protein YigA (DUF484 family)